MAFLEAAKTIVCNIIAVALAMSVSAVEALLPTRPEWLERVNELALHLKTIYENRKKPTEPAPEPESETPAAAAEAVPEPELPLSTETAQLLLAYNHLWQFVHGVRSDGLLLDDKFCERVEREWTVTTLLSYVRNADRSLQQKAAEALDTAATYMAAAWPNNNPPSDRSF